MKTNRNITRSPYADWEEVDGEIVDPETGQRYRLIDPPRTSARQTRTPPRSTRTRQPTTEEMFESAPAKPRKMTQREMREEAQRRARLRELERKVELKQRYGRWYYVGRRAPRAFLLAGTAATAGLGVGIAAGHFSASAFVGWFVAWGFVIGCLNGGWPQLDRAPAQPPSRGRHTGETMLGYMIMHHLIRRGFHHKHRSLGR